MNKQELIDRIKRLDEPYLKAEFVLELIKQLDKPEKVKVKQFVADWIEVCKEHLTTSLYTAMNPNFMKENNQSFDLILWIKKPSNQETFALAWILGYEVEKESKYIVKLKNVPYLFGILNFSKRSKQWHFSDSNTNRTHVTKHTRKELEEAGFGWVFDCEGIEIEELEDEI